LFLYDVNKKLEKIEINKFILSQYLSEADLFFYLLKQFKDYYFFNSKEYREWKNDFDYHFKVGA
jgi:hypothetical protein